MSSMSYAAKLPAITSVLLAVALLGACAGAQPGAEPASPGVQARPSGTADVLTRAQIERINASTMEQLMLHRFNGVRVDRVGGELILRIRSENEPLLVLNGAPGLSMSSFWQLDPSDIEEIRVLRESASSMYGLEGANGVLLITTRRR